MSGTIDFANIAQSGAYLVGTSDLDALDAEAHANGLLTRRIPLPGCRAKTDLLQRIAAALAFPKTFGDNWDALADCLADLAWLPHADGIALLFDHAEDLRDALTAEFDTFLKVLDDAAATWKLRGTVCFAFVALPDDDFPGA